MKTYDFQSDGNLDLILEHVGRNTPFLLKRVLSAEDCVRMATNIRSVEIEETAYGGYPANRADGARIEEDLALFQTLRQRPEFYVQPDTRIWRHKKGNFTRNHYDGNGVHVMNLCLAGSKKFSVAPPGTFWTLPLSNIGVRKDPPDAQFAFTVTLTPGDLLYIPKFWFHKVRTLEDDAVNVNLNFYETEKCKVVHQRNDDLLQLHRLVKSHMWRVDTHNDCVGKVQPRSLLRRMATEGGLVALVAFALASVLVKSWWHLAVAVAATLTLMFNRRFSILFYGTSEMYGYFILPVLVLAWLLNRKGRRTNRPRKR